MTKGEGERRRAHRKPVKVEVQVGIEKAHGLVYFDTSDISRSGAFLVSDLLLDVGERLMLTLHVPGRNPPITAKARIVRVNADPRKRPADPPPGMGIEFISMASEDEATLDRFLHAASHAGAAKK